MALDAGEIAATLTLRDQLSAEMTKVTGSVTKQLSLLAGSAAAGFAFREAKAAAVSVIALTGHLDDLSKKTGISAEAIQELDFVAKQSGSSFDEISQALALMAKNLIGGDKGTAEAMQKLGLSLAEVTAMKPDQAFQAIGAAIAQIPDPMQRSQIAMELFGRSGATLLPVLTSDIGGLRDVARETGTVISNDLVKSGDELGDAWTRIEAQMKAMTANALLPALEVFTQLPVPMQGIIGIGIQMLPTIAALGTAWVTIGSTLSGLIVPLFTSALPAAFSAILPFLGPIGIIAVAVGAVYLAWKHWDKIVEIAMAVYNGVKTWLVDKFNAVVESIKGKIDAVTGFFRGMYNAVVGQSYVPDMIAGIQASFASLSGVMVAPAEAATAFVSGVFATMRDTVIGVVQNMISRISGMLTGWLDGFLPSWAAQLVGGLSTSIMKSVAGKVLGGTAIGEILGLGGGAAAAGGAAAGAGGAGGAAATAAGGIGIGSTVALTAGIAGAAVLAWAIWKKGLFRGGEEALKVNPARDAFFDALGPPGWGPGSARRMLADTLFALDHHEALFTALSKADTMKEFDAAIKAIQARLHLAEAQQAVNDAGAAGVGPGGMPIGVDILSKVPGGGILGGIDMTGREIQQFATGTPGLGFQSFGSGTLVAVHGDEAIVPRSRAGEFIERYGGGWNLIVGEIHLHDCGNKAPRQLVTEFMDEMADRLRRGGDMRTKYQTALGITP